MLARQRKTSLLSSKASWYPYQCWYPVSLHSATLVVSLSNTSPSPSLSPAAKMVNMPNVVGMPAADGQVILEGAGFTSIVEREVLAVDIDDSPGALGELAGRIAAAGVNVDLVYLATGPRLVLGAADLDAVRAAI